MDDRKTEVHSSVFIPLLATFLQSLLPLNHIDTLIDFFQDQSHYLILEQFELSMSQKKEHPTGECG